MYTIKPLTDRCSIRLKIAHHPLEFTYLLVWAVPPVVERRSDNQECAL